MALPHDATVCLQFVIVVFPDHTHLLFLALSKQVLFVLRQAKPSCLKQDLF